MDTLEQELQQQINEISKEADLFRYSNTLYLY